MTPHPNVITFPQTTDAELTLADDFAKRMILEEAFEGMAQTLYRMRALWVGNMCLPWGMLTDGQRDGYVAEVRALVTKARHEQ